MTTAEKTDTAALLIGSALYKKTETHNCYYHAENNNLIVFDPDFLMYEADVINATLPNPLKGLLNTLDKQTDIVVYWSRTEDENSGFDIFLRLNVGVLKDKHHTDLSRYLHISAGKRPGKYNMVKNCVSTAIEY